MHWSGISTARGAGSGFQGWDPGGCTVHGEGRRGRSNNKRMGNRLSAALQQATGAAATFAAGAALALAMSAVAWGQPPSLPDAVQPGAVRPGEERPRAQVQPDPGAVYEVPPVIERPLDIDDGERILVSRFELKGVMDRPAMGIAQEEIQALVDAKRLERPEGFTVGRLQEVATEVTRYYRGKGMILAQAFVPVQTVQDGVVVIEVLEGRLGRVLPEGNEMYKTETIERPFQGLVDQPVTQAGIEAALLGLTDYPGLVVFGVFQPGQQVGTADMVLKVQEERRFDASIRFDNHGLRETGRRRGRIDLAVNNVTGVADKLRGVFQHTDKPANSMFWEVGYERPIFRPGYSVHASYSRNDFDVGGEFERLDIVSDTQTGIVGLKRQIIRSRQRNLAGTLDLARRQAVTDIRDREVTRDDLTVLSLALDYDSVDTRFSGLNAASLVYSHGFNDVFGSMGDSDSAARKAVPPSRRGGSGRFAEGSFDKIFGSYSRLQSLRPLADWIWPAFWDNKSVLLRAEGQWSDDLLVPLEQYAIGGPNHVRAYQPTEVLFDSAWFVSVEYIMNAPGFHDQPAFQNRTWGELLQLSLFYDASGGERNDPLVSDIDSEVYSGAGIGLSFNLPRKFSSRFSMAWPISPSESVNDRKPQFWFDLNYTFF